MQLIVPGGPQRLALRLVAYEPNGARLGVLPAHLGWEAGLPLNDVSSLRLTYSASAPGAELLSRPCEIAMEYAVDGGPWLEPENGRFLRVKRSGDGTDRTGARSYDCPGWAWMLRKIVLYPDLSMVDGKRPFTATTPGDILGTLIREGKNRGTLPGLSYTFTDTRDSAGQLWGTTLSLGLDPGVDLLALLINLSEQGQIDWCMQGRELKVYREGTVLATDRASGPGPVELRLGRDIDSAPDDATMEDAASAILVVGEEGLRVEVTNPAATMPWGRWEAYQSQGGVTDTGTAQLLGRNALDRAAGERVQLTRSITPYVAAWLPLADYASGDYVRAPGDQGVMQALRVRQVTLSCGPDGLIGGNITLNDRFLERDIRLARRAAGILAGGVSSGGSGADPAPEDGDREPAAPTGLLVSPAAYLDEEGYAHGQITVSWQPVTEDVNGTSITVDGYELVGVTPPGTGATRVLATTSGTTVTYSPLEPKSRWQFGVVAIKGTARSQITASPEIVIPDDETPPPEPSTPVVDSRLGIFRVSWDGFTAAGTGMPIDFARVLIMMRDPLNPDDEGRQVEWLERAGTAVVPDQPYNVDRELWLTAIDRSGNISGESARVVGQTKPLVDTDIIGQVIDGATAIIDGTVPADAKIVAGSITGGLIQALAIQAGHISANAITADKIEVGAITAAHIAAAAITADKIAAGSINAEKITADALNGKTITGPVIRSAPTGRRFVLDSSTLDLRFYPSGGSNYSRIYSQDSGGEAAIYITTNTSSSQRAELQVDSSLIRLGMQNSNGSQRGGGLDIADDYAQFGYSTGSSSSETYIFLNSSGRFFIRGRVWDANETSPYDAFAAGSFSVGGGSTPHWASYRYGPPGNLTPMATNMGPVVTLRDGGSGGPDAFGNSYEPKAWALTASTTEGFQVNLANATSFAIYFWAHRH